MKHTLLFIRDSAPYILFALTGAAHLLDYQRLNNQYTGIKTAHSVKHVFLRTPALKGVEIRANRILE